MVMNITDIDDKIIIKARQNALVADFKSKHATLTADVQKTLLASLDAEIGVFPFECTAKCCLFVSV